MAGLAVFTAASLACALASTDAFLIASRAVQGLGAAFMLPAALSIVMNMFKEGAERNKALGIWGGLGAAGATVGLIAGRVSHAVRRLAVHLLPERADRGARDRVGSAGRSREPVGDHAPAVRRGRRDHQHRRTRVAGGRDLTGAAVRLGSDHGRSRVLSAAAALLVAFVVIESRVSEPILPLSIFRRRTLAGANVAGLLLGGSFFAFIFVGTLYMQQVLHYSALQTGVAWLAASLTSIVLAGVSQLLVTRVGAKPVLLAGMTLIGAGIIWATQVPVHGHFLANLAGPMTVAGAGTAFAFIPISIAALAGVEERRAGLASGLLNTSEQLGGAIGIAIASSVAASHTKALAHAGNAVPVALTGGFQHALWVLGAIALISLPAIFVLVRRRELAPGATAATTPERQPGQPVGGDPKPALAGTN